MWLTQRTGTDSRLVRFRPVSPGVLSGSTLCTHSFDLACLPLRHVGDDRQV